MSSVLCAVRSGHKRGGGRMLDRTLRRVIDPCLEPVAGLLQRSGVQANWVTVLGFLLGLGGCAAIAAGHIWLGLVLILSNRLADGLDGMVARRSGGAGLAATNAGGGSDLGGFLDIVLDLLFYALVPLSFGLLNRERNLLPAAVLLVSFLGTSGSFLAYAVMMAKRGESGREKSFFYSAGLMEGSETVLFFVAFCVFPGWFAELAWVFAGLCFLTTLQRLAAGLRSF